MMMVCGTDARGTPPPSRSDVRGTLDRLRPMRKVPSLNIVPKDPLGTRSGVLANANHRSVFASQPATARFVKIAIRATVYMLANRSSTTPAGRHEGAGMARDIALGHQVHAALKGAGASAAQQRALELGAPDLFDRVQAVALEEPIPSFLHSALCAMSLPVRRPADDTLPIIRQDGQYTLAITPRPVLRRVDGQPQQMTVLGVPYGSLPRLVLIHIMTEAVRTRSRHIVLGTSFTDWMRRMGFRTVSYGPRGSATLIREQLDRLLACEWMIRWDNKTAQGDEEFAVKEVKLTNDYVGINGRNGSFSREIMLTEGFFDHLREHAVPLDENAIRQLRDSATALDLYTWLAYRLPRLSKNRPVLISWPQLAVHFGNEARTFGNFGRRSGRLGTGMFPRSIPTPGPTSTPWPCDSTPLQPHLPDGR